jgi:hypothetical protein
VNIIPGSYVTHAKMLELGSGEVLSAGDGAVCIRFASGNRSFKLDLVMRHLQVTTEAPAPAPQKGAKRARKTPVAKAKGKASSEA